MSRARGQKASRSNAQRRQRTTRGKELQELRQLPQCSAGCGKRAYPNEHAAMGVMARQKGEARVYYCEPGESWHVTSSRRTKR
ncbi:MAG: hypothetical protein ACEQSX_08005 [Baekduiaceae bacterium]